MRLLLAAFLFLGGCTAVSAQGCGSQNPNCIVPTAPVGTNNNQAASTAFVQQNVAGFLPTLQPGQVFGNNSSSAAVAAAISGVDTNALNARTTTYTAQTSDCGKTITLGGSAFYTFMVSAASGFPATCTMVVVNVDSTRGKTITINGTNFPNNNILWPLQTFGLKNENNIWTVVAAPGRWRLVGSTSFYVDPTLGSDSNDGLATGSGAFQHINTAVALLGQIIDANTNAVSINVPSCSSLTTISEAQISMASIVGASTGGGLGSNNPTIIGNTTTPTNCILAGNSAVATIFSVDNTTDWIVQGFQIKNSGAGGGVLVDANAHLRLGNMDFNVVGSNHMTAEDGGILEPLASYSISAGAVVHVITTNRGQFLIGGSDTITLTGTPAFSADFALASGNSLQNWAGASFSGSATGVRYSADLGGGINTNGGGANFFPGNSPGVVANPGWYN